MGIKNQHNWDNMERCPEVIVKDHEVRAMSCQGRQNKKSDRGSVARHDTVIAETSRRGEPTI